jgi:hypothetical protein
MTEKINENDRFDGAIRNHKTVVQLEKDGRPGRQIVMWYEPGIERCRFYILEANEYLETRFPFGPVVVELIEDNGLMEGVMMGNMRWKSLFSRGVAQCIDFKSALKQCGCTEKNIVKIITINR